MGYVMNKNNVTTDYIYNDVNKLLNRFKFKEAYKYLVENVEVSQLSCELEKKYFYYYLSKSLILGFEKTDEALIYLKKIELWDDWNGEENLIDILIVNTIAVAYDLKDDKKQAEKYFDKTVEKILSCKMFPEENFSDAIVMLYNCAKFYSTLKEHERSIDLCNVAIEVAKNLDTFKHLDKIYYEAGFNYYQVQNKKKAATYFTYAYTFANLNNNTVLKKIILNDAKDFNLLLEFKTN